MAWVNFQKSNWTRTVFPSKDAQYFPGSSNGTATGNLTFVGTAIKTLTLTAAFNFKGNGLISVWGPTGSSSYQTAAAQGIVIENAWLAAPPSGSYSAGNHPLILVNISNASTATVTTATTGFDLVAMQL